MFLYTTGYSFLYGSQNALGLFLLVTGVAVTPLLWLPPSIKTESYQDGEQMNSQNALGSVACHWPSLWF